MKEMVPEQNIRAFCNRVKPKNMRVWFGCRCVQNIWPETVRALLVHSAQWSEKMKAQFGVDKDKSKTGARRTLLRCCGYGIPSLENAMQCLSNSVSLVIEGEIQPYCKDTSIKMNEMHLHQIPWPKDLLQQLGEIPVTMRVTLSYFIEPGPGEIGWKDKYRYASRGLRFDVKNANETPSDFRKRINRAMREDKEDKGSCSSGAFPAARIKCLCRADGKK